MSSIAPVRTTTAPKRAVGAVGAQAVQATGSLILQVVAARLLGIEGLGAFAIAFGGIVLMSAVVTGFVGDSLTALDRNDGSIRAGLRGWSGLLLVGGGISVAVAGSASGILSPGGSVACGVAAAAFCAEELTRRLHIAQLRFDRVIAVDVTALAVSVLVVLVATVTEFTLGTLFFALALGQIAGATAGLVLARDRRPRHRKPGPRRSAPFGGAAWGTVARFGGWRAAQQALRPAVLTGMRVAIMTSVGLAATGSVEAARIYLAPTMLLVGGISSWLFAEFARLRDQATADLLGHADRTVVRLVAGVAALGVVSVLLAPIAGPALLGHNLDLAAAAGWAAFAVSIAAVTPYGALVALGGRPALSFAVRATDSLLALGLVLLLLALDVPAVSAPWALATASLLGGIALRFWALPHTTPDRKGTL